MVTGGSTQPTRLKFRNKRNGVLIWIAYNIWLFIQAYIPELGNFAGHFCLQKAAFIFRPRDFPELPSYTEERAEDV